ncbi:MAG: GTP-binding protein [Tolypothrix sp. T3-bin4]|nr:GTP-binding protein [Tolypothrix sp. Co-bin9]MBD0302261.1 GTP-binding protein [Tolypothrix sp. T3-bin4]
MLPIITVVAGPVGCGKTTWISQQLALREKIRVKDENVLYFSPGTGTVPIDQTRIAAQFPRVKVFSDTQETEFINQLGSSDAVYIELGFCLELSTVTQILNNLPYRAIAILPPHLKDSEWHSWTNEIIPGADAQTSLAQAQFWRASSTGEVIEENSLEEFWYEITHNAYGTVSRAKGIFNVDDGRYLYADFTAGVTKSEFIELNSPRHLEGRPQRFSGLEIFAENLDEVNLRQTLQDCCLSESAILYYQEQAKQLVTEEIKA